MTTEKKEREVPICHRTLAPIPGTDGDGNSIAIFWSVPCIGSRCAMWVPEHFSQMQVRNGDDEPWIDLPSRVITVTEGPNGTIVNGYSDYRTVNRSVGGRCADNMSAECWPDPAAKEQP